MTWRFPVLGYADVKYVYDSEVNDKEFFVLLWNFIDYKVFPMFLILPESHFFLPHSNIYEKR